MRWGPRLGERVAAARQRAGLTRAELADRLGVTEESVRRWEAGWTQPSADRLARLLVVLALDEAALGGGLAGGERRDRNRVAERDAAEREADLPPLARLLRRERRERAMSQAAAAEAIGVAQGTYAGWETGRAAPERSLWPRVARFLGLSVDEVAHMAATPLRPPSSEALSPLGRLMAERRAELGLSRGALAGVLGVSPRTVGAWERGEKTPRSARLRRLASVLGVDPGAVAAAVSAEPAAPPLAALIERERLARGLSVEQLAAEAAVAPSTLARWASGRHRPTPSALRRLARALDLDAETLGRAATGA